MIRYTHAQIAWWKAALYAMGNRVPFWWIDTRRPASTGPRSLI